jgi:hypothetical protein
MIIAKWRPIGQGCQLLKKKLTSQIIGPNSNEMTRILLEMKLTKRKEN